MNQTHFFQAVEEIGDIDYRLSLMAWSYVINGEFSFNNNFKIIIKINNTLIFDTKTKKQV